MVMFTSHTPTPQPATSPPQSPSRIGRLTLSYLRTYSHHLHLRSDSVESAPRQRSSPLPSPGPQSPGQVSATSSRPLSPEDVYTSLQLHSPTALVAPPPSAATSPANPPPHSPAFPPLNGGNNHHTMSLQQPPAGAQATLANNTASSTLPAATPQQPDTQMPSVRFVPHHDPRASRPSLTFQAISRTLPTHEAVIKVGRYSERDQYGVDLARGSGTSAAPVGFKSKVVSRKHCEFWCDKGQWYIKDVKSSSGTFLNHLRLSPPGVESKPWRVNDGDVVQLGIDFKGGEEPIYRCVKIRIECNRSWQKAPNPFNKSTHRRIRKMAAQRNAKRDSDTASLNSTDCTICLMSISPCQSLFVAPCSHVWHYKCIRPILNGQGYPNLLCPNCRASIDLEADVEEADSDWEDDLQEAIEASKKDTQTGDEPPAATATMVPVTAEHATGARNPPGVDTDGDFEMLDANGSDSHQHAARNQAPLPTRAAPPAPIALGESQNFANGGHTSEGAAAGLVAPTPARNIPRNSNGPTVGEGPMTPRNDAGPFVLDGGAGRAGRREIGSTATPTS